MQSVLSVVIPVYNVEAYLEKSISSVVNQSYRNLEILLVNDGSTDGSGGICKKYAAADSRIKYMEQANAGSGEARNAGIAAATGRYITFLDSDDHWAPDYAVKMMAAAAKADIAVCDFYFEDENGSTRLSEIRMEPDMPYKVQDEPDIINRARTYLWGKVFRTSLLRDNKIRQPSMAINDFPIVCLLVAKAAAIIRVGEPLIYYLCAREGNTVTSVRSLFSIYDALEALYENFKGAGLLEIYGKALHKMYYSQVRFGLRKGLGSAEYEALKDRLCSFLNEHWSEHPHILGHTFYSADPVIREGIRRVIIEDAQLADAPEKADVIIKTGDVIINHYLQGESLYWDVADKILFSAGGMAAGAAPKIALCIPTYDHPELIRELLETELPCISDNHFALHIFDSSDTSATEKIFNENEGNACSIAFHRMPSDMHANKKVYEIYQNASLLDSFDYLWVCGDAMRFSSETLSKIMKLAETDAYDMILLDNSCAGNTGKNIYHSADELFTDEAWIMALFGSTIIRTGTMLRNLEWMYLKEKYLSDKAVNFSHIGLYAEAMMRIKNFAGYVLRLNHGEMYVSGLKREHSWTGDTFDIWFQKWPYAIKMLPEYYSRKEQAADNMFRYSKFLDKRELERLRANGIFDRTVLNKYENRISELSKLSLSELYEIADTPSDYYKDKIKTREASLLDFCRTHEHLVIYGAGENAGRMYMMIRERGFDVDCFMVSRLSDNVKIHYGHEVTGIDALAQQPEHTGIILGLNPHDSQDVKKILEEKCLSEDIFI